jgi:hypothetical protein
MADITGLRKNYKSRYRRELEVLAVMIANELESIADDGENFRHTPSIGGVCSQITELSYMLKAVDDMERLK